MSMKKQEFPNVRISYGSEGRDAVVVCSACQMKPRRLIGPGMTERARAVAVEHEAAAHTPRSTKTALGVDLEIALADLAVAAHRVTVIAGKLRVAS